GQATIERQQELVARGIAEIAARVRLEHADGVRQVVLVREAGVDLNQPDAHASVDARHHADPARWNGDRRGPTRAPCSRYQSAVSAIAVERSMAGWKPSSLRARGESAT